MKENNSKRAKGLIKHAQWPLVPGNPVDYSNLLDFETRTRSFKWPDPTPNEELRLLENSLYPVVKVVPATGSLPPANSASKRQLDNQILHNAIKSLGAQTPASTIVLHSVLDSASQPPLSHRRGNLISTTSSNSIWVSATNTIHIAQFQHPPFILSDLTNKRWRPLPRFCIPGNHGLLSFSSPLLTNTNACEPILDIQMIPNGPQGSSSALARSSTAIRLFDVDWRSPDQSPFDLPPETSDDEFQSEPEVKGKERGDSSRGPAKLPFLSRECEIRGSQLAGLPIADAALSFASGAMRGPLDGGMVADRAGNLWGWSSEWEGGKPRLFSLRKRCREKEYDGLVKVQFAGPLNRDAIMALSDQVLLYDLRTPRTSISLLAPSQLSRPLTSMAYRSSRNALLSSVDVSQHVCPTHIVSTSKDVLWIDERMPGTILFKKAHEMGSEARLTSLSGSLDDSADRVFIHSPKHSHLSILTCKPSSLTSAVAISTLYPQYTTPLRSPCTSLSVTPGSRQSPPSYLVLQRGLQGEIWSQYLTAKTSRSRGIQLPGGGMHQQTLDVDLIRKQWGGGTRKVEEASENLWRDTLDADVNVGGWESTHGLLNVLEEHLMRMMTFDARVANRKERRRKKRDGKAGKAEATNEVEVEDLTEHARGEGSVNEDEDEDIKERADEGALPKRLQEMVAVVRLLKENGQKRRDRGIITMFDLFALDTRSTCIDPLPHPSTFRRRLRLADVEFSATASNSLVKYTHSVEVLAAWSVNTDVLGDHPAEYEGDKPLNSILQPAQALEETYGEGESDASKVVALDHFLAQKAHSFRPLDPTAAGLAPAWKSQSTSEAKKVSFDESSILGSQTSSINPPPLKFAYFRIKDYPRPRTVHDVEHHRRWKWPSLQSEGVRRLNAEWTVGDEIDDYVWINPYTDVIEDAEWGVGEEEKGRRSLKGSSRASSSTPWDSTATNAPPALASQVVPSITVSSFSASQPLPSSMSGFPSSPTLVESASQVVPGAFGGRVSFQALSAARKKDKGKKRMSGF
ncbi:hypothetical protein T439DRAFT_322723 [Meredithblackwellia eburnea MCA 4105]